MLARPRCVPCKSHRHDWVYVCVRVKTRKTSEQLNYLFFSFFKNKHKNPNNPIFPLLNKCNCVSHPPQTDGYMRLITSPVSKMAVARLSCCNFFEVTMFFVLKLDVGFPHTYVLYPMRMLHINRFVNESFSWVLQYWICRWKEWVGCLWIYKHLSACWS